jgi:phage terminase large subunit
MRAVQNPNGRYCYIAPYYAQAKLAAWDYLKQFSAEIRAGSPHETELRVDLFNGSRVRLFGADNPDSLRGAGWDGVVLDEYAQCRPSLWGAVLRPALADRKGWATFIGTPMGRQGLYDIWKGIGQWAELDFFKLMLKASETGILDEEELRDMRRAMTPEEYEQEAECSFEAAIIGAVYGRLMAAADADKRICSVPYDPSALVWTGWDLGIDDSTAIWFAQTVGKELHIIDYYENRNEDAAHYAALVKSKPYQYGGHILPHDAAAKELTSGKGVADVLGALGLAPLTVLPRPTTGDSVEDGINTARMKIPMTWFDANKCEKGIDALRLYRYEYDEKLRTLKTRPIHDWTSHAADAFRYLCLGLASGPGPGSNFHRKITYDHTGIV